jgi:hypothetical protein
MRQQPLGALQDRDFGAGTCGQMRELRSDIAAADQHDPARQRLQLEESVACAHQLLARNAERDRPAPLAIRICWACNVRPSTTTASGLAKRASPWKASTPSSA